MRHMIISEKRTGTGLVIDTIRYYPTREARDAARREYIRRGYNEIRDLSLRPRSAYQFPFGLRARIIPIKEMA